MPDSALASISVSAHLSMKMTPSVGLSKRAIHLIIVLFPAPLGPTIHVSPSSSAGDNLSGVHRIKIACSEDQQNRTDQNQWRQNGHRPPIRFQKPPISHVSRFLSPSALDAYFRIDTPAEKRLLIAVPVKTRILILFLLNLATKDTNISIPRTIASAASHNRSTPYGDLLHGGEQAGVGVRQEASGHELIHVARLGGQLEVGHAPCQLVDLIRASGRGQHRVCAASEELPM